MDAVPPAAADALRDVDDVLAAIRALAGVDDPAARAALVACLDAEPAVAAAASAALGQCGKPALDVCIAAVRQPERARFAALALARIGPDGRAAVALWRALPGAPPATRIAIAAALHRGPRQAPAALGRWLREETHDAVTFVLVDLLGRLPAGALEPTTVAHLAGLSRTAASPFVRALATWAATAHGVDDLVPTAVDLLDDPVAGPALIAYVARRGGPLQPLVDGMAPRPGLDPAAELLDALDDVSGTGGGHGR